MIKWEFYFIRNPGISSLFTVWVYLIISCLIYCFTLGLIIAGPYYFVGSRSLSELFKGKTPDFLCYSVTITLIILDVKIFSGWHLRSSIVDRKTDSSSHLLIFWNFLFRSGWIPGHPFFRFLIDRTENRK